MNPDRAQLAALSDHIDAERVRAQAARRARIRRDVLARLLGPVRVPATEPKE